MSTGGCSVCCENWGLWERVLENDVVLQVRLSPQGKRDIPRRLFHESLTHALHKTQLIPE